MSTDELIETQNTICTILHKIFGEDRREFEAHAQARGIGLESLAAASI
jgi:hypothetical protein